MSREEINDTNVPEGGSDQAPQQAHGHGLSRRNLLVGSAGLTVGSMVGASAATAQSGQTGAESHGNPSASLGNRIYSANPEHPNLADISENPANVPPPITRTEPTTLTHNIKLRLRHWQKQYSKVLPACEILVLAALFLAVAPLTNFCRKINAELNMDCKNSTTNI